MKGYKGSCGISEREVRETFSVQETILDTEAIKGLYMDGQDMDKLNILDGSIVYAGTDRRITAARAFKREMFDGEAGVTPVLARILNVRQDDKVTCEVTTRRCRVVKRLSVTIAITRATSERVLSRCKATFLELYGDGVPLLHGEWVPVQLASRKNPIMVRVHGDPNGPFRVGKTTRVEWNEMKCETNPAGGLLRGKGIVDEEAWTAIGGLDDTIAEIRDIVEYPLLHPEIGERYRKRMVRGVLLSGPPGCGKTLIGRAIAKECNASFFDISAASVLSKFLGESENRVKSLFKTAREEAPSVIFIDEIDALAGNKGDTNERMVSQLLIEMDGFETSDRVVVIGATNKPEHITPAFRRPGRFEVELLVKAPEEEGREQILDIHLANTPRIKNEQDAADLARTLAALTGRKRHRAPLRNTPVDTRTIARETRGFTGADLAGLVRKAISINMKHAKQCFPDVKGRIPQAFIELLTLSMEDFNEALAMLKPAALRSTTQLASHVGWSDVGGLEGAKRQLEQAVCWQFTRREAVTRMGIRLPKGVLLWGPPGTGKTLLAKAAAGESGCNFVAVSGPELLSKWHGESEANVRKLFEKARQVSPCIVFFDEIDALAPVRGNDVNGVEDRVVAQLLAEMDGMRPNDGIVIIATTNRPELVDPAFLRNGRIDRRIFIDLPDEKTRRHVLEVHLRGKNLHPSVDVDALLDQLASLTPGLSGADLESLVMNVGISAIERGKDAMDIDDFVPLMSRLEARLGAIVLEIEKEEEQDELEEIERKRQERLVKTAWHEGYI